MLPLLLLSWATRNVTEISEVKLARMQFLAHHIHVFLFDED